MSLAKSHSLCGAVVLSMLWVSLGAGCTPKDDPEGTPTSSVTTPTTQAEWPTYVHAIEAVWETQLGSTEHAYSSAEHLDGGQAILVGSNGYKIIDVETGDVSWEVDGGYTGIEIAIDGPKAWITSGVASALYLLDTTDPDGLVVAGPLAEATDSPRYVSIAAHDGLILVGTYRDASLLDEAGENVASIPGASHGVALEEGRALIADADELVLYDLTEPTLPVELDRVSLSGTGWDVEWDGERVAVALASDGLDVLSLIDDTLKLEHSLNLGHTATDVVLDGDDIWLAASGVTILAELLPEGPVVVAHEPSTPYTQGIAAKDGLALMSQLDNIRGVRRVPGASGPELSAPETLFAYDDSTVLNLTLHNRGAHPLEVAAEVTETYTLAETHWTIEPGDSVDVEIGVLDPVEGVVTLTSNDPDETTSVVHLSVDGILGTPHADFFEMARLWPDNTELRVGLSDFAGKVTVFNYFLPECAICAIDVPQFEVDLAPFLAEPDFDYVLVGIESQDDSWAFIDALEIERLMIQDVDEKMYRSYGEAIAYDSAVTVPLHVVIDRSGIITHFDQSGDKLTLMADIEATLNSGK